MICPICNKKFESNHWNKKYCSAECRRQKCRLINIKELFRLTPEEKQLRKRLREDENTTRHRRTL